MKIFCSKYTKFNDIFLGYIVWVCEAMSLMPIGFTLGGPLCLSKTYKVLETFDWAALQRPYRFCVLRVSVLPKGRLTAQSEGPRRTRRSTKVHEEYNHFFCNCSTSQLLNFSVCSGYVQWPVSTERNNVLGAVITLYAAYIEVGGQTYH